MKSIDLEKMYDYLDPLAIRSNPAILMATDGKETNGLTVGWASFGILWRKIAASVYIHKTRFSKHIFDNAEYYAICYFDDDCKDQIQYFGTVSGRDENKIEKTRLTLVAGEEAPYFAESKLVVICKRMGQCDFDADSCEASVQDWYKKDGVHTQYMGEIVKILVKE